MNNDSDIKTPNLKARLAGIVDNTAFNIVIQLLILGSAIAFVLETEPELEEYNVLFLIADWSFLLLFTLEYILRIYTAPDKKAFIFSFFGLVDLIAILPSLVLIPGLGHLPGFHVLRILRFLRVFRIFKATRFILAVDRMIEALGEVRRELLALVILSSMMVYLSACGIYFFEKEAQPENFGTIPKSMWWAIVSLTTIGYGDVYPVTPGGKVFTAFVALVGVGLIAIPSGLLASVLTEARVEGRLEDENENRDN
ncbi:ion transporter [Candidatus Poribacteria bacterium]|nr:ion transporter [Candidatus Poribacteria bacterium]